MAKDAYYFSHDSNAHKDPKILKLRATHGWYGYGVFWAIIETLREQEDYKWEANDKQLLSFCFSNGEAEVNQVIETCLEIGLLTIDEDGFIYSISLTNRMKKREEVAEKRRQAGQKGGSSKQKESKSEANAKQNASKESKGKESKSNETENETEKDIKKEYADYVFLTETEYDKLTELLGNDERDNYFLRFASWISGQTKRVQQSRSAYLTILNWYKDADKKPKVNFGQKNYGNVSSFTRLQQMAKEAEEREASGHY